MTPTTAMCKLTENCSMRIPKQLPTHWKNERHRVYFSALFNATPPWLSAEDRDKFYRIYREARERRRRGEDVQVDHMVPMIHPHVCGLNVWWNLEILPSAENSRKGNRFWPGHPLQQCELTLMPPPPKQLSLGFEV